MKSPYWDGTFDLVDWPKCTFSPYNMAQAFRLPQNAPRASRLSYVRDQSVGQHGVNLNLASSQTQDAHGIGPLAGNIYHRWAPNVLPNYW